MGNFEFILYYVSLMLVLTVLAGIESARHGPFGGRKPHTDTYKALSQAGVRLTATAIVCASIALVVTVIQWVYRMFAYLIS